MKSPEYLIAAKYEVLLMKFVFELLVLLPPLVRLRLIEATSGLFVCFIPTDDICAIGDSGYIPLRERKP